jgi:hypothetical protein
MEKLMPVDFLQEQEDQDADGWFMKGYSQSQCPAASSPKFLG